MVEKNVSCAVGTEAVQDRIQNCIVLYKRNELNMSLYQKSPEIKKYLQMRGVAGMALASKHLQLYLIAITET